MKPRIASLDLIRGFALLGVLAVNAAFFAAPIVSVINPAYGPLAVTPGTSWSWFVPYVFFEYKSMALFSMLFGASLFLVGGERGDPVRASGLHRRLAWLAVFGVLHGVLLWYGDILLSYAMMGALVMLARSWQPRGLLILGVILFTVSMGVIGAVAAMILTMSPADQATFAATSWAPPAEYLARAIAAYHRGWGVAQLNNFASWIEFQLQTLILLSLRTAGLMLIGMALFKNGFLTGAASQRTYVWTTAIGAAALAVMVWNGWDIARQGFAMPRLQGTGTLILASLSPIVALGYAAALVLILRAGWLHWLTTALAAVGRVAFTNYLSQSIVMSTIFWSGRGLGLYGELSRPKVMTIALALFVAQMIFSSWWLRRHDHGPFEAVWRRLSRPSARASA